MVVRGRIRAPSAGVAGRIVGVGACKRTADRADPIAGGGDCIGGGGGARLAQSIAIGIVRPPQRRAGLGGNGDAIERIVAVVPSERRIGGMGSASDAARIVVGVAIELLAI